MTFRRNVKNNKGFTLVELIVVIAVIGVLAAIAIPKISSSADAARGAKLQADLRTIDTACMMALANGGTITAGAIAAPVTDYLQAVPVPPSGKFTATKTTTATTITGTAYEVTAAGRATIDIGGTDKVAEDL